MAKKYTSHYSGKRIDHSVGVIPAGDPSDPSVIVYSGVDKDGNPISTYEKVSEVGATVVQATGDSETQVMSQKAVTDKLDGKASTSYVQGYVQGNPTASGTVDLTKLKVGNTVYNVPQGTKALKVTIW